MKNRGILFKAGILLYVCLIFLGCLPQNKVIIKKTPQGGYLLFNKGKPFLIKGVIYNPTPICQGYDYDLFSDPCKPWLVDGKLMQEMGVNTIRIYSANSDLQKVKSFIKEVYENFGIYTIVSDWLGLWESPSPNYADEEFQKRITQRVLSIVRALKDEEGVLMWVLGNENNYTFSGKIAFWTSPQIEKIPNLYERVKKRAQIYYSFVDKLARKIKEIDPNHPVALGNGEVSMLQVAGKVCKNIDAVAVISYRGKRFGNLFDNIKYVFDKPVLVSEFGADSWDALKNEPAEEIQAEYLSLQWRDIFENTPFGGDKKGNCLGGTLFEWTDEWWKHNEGYAPDWCLHNTEAGWSNGSYYFDIQALGNLNMNEEWFGVVGLSKEKKDNLNKRIPKKSFYTLKSLWRGSPSK